MPSLLSCLVLCALVSFVLAMPPPQMHQLHRRSFEVKRQPNPHFKGRSPGAGTRALIKAHRKYRLDLPKALTDAMAAAHDGAHAANGFTASSKANRPHAAAPRNGTSPDASVNGTGIGIVTATPEAQDVEFLSPVQIGGQTLNMDFDSGSSDLWVFNTQLSATTTKGHQIYNPLKSTSFKLIQGATYSVSYGDDSGSAGNVGTDTVNIGGATVTSQAIELATAISQSFIEDTQSSGLVGLAFSKLNTVQPQQQKTFFDNAVATLPLPVFTADLRSNAVGSYTFGAIDTTRFTGPLQWAAINTTSGFWQFSSQTFQVGNDNPIKVAGAQAIADTGTTLMLASPAVVNAYYSQVQGAVNNQTVGGVTVPCNQQLPDLAFDVGGSFMATVRGSDINFAEVDQTGENCFGGLQAITGPMQIYGDIMFKSQFVAFDAGNDSIGMAPHDG